MTKKPKQFTPNELKALWYWYGDARTAAKKLNIGTGTLIENATADVRGLERALSEATQAKIRKTWNRLSDKTQRKIKNLAANLSHYPEETVQKAILKTKPSKRKKLFDDFKGNVREVGKEGNAWLIFKIYLTGE